MIDITTSITPIELDYAKGSIIGKWVGSVAIKGGVDGNILHWHIESENARTIVENQICLLENINKAIEKRIKLLESSLRD